MMIARAMAIICGVTGVSVCYLCLDWDNIGCFIYQGDIAAVTCCIGFAVCSLRCINKVGSSFCGKVFAQIVWQEFPFSL